MKPIFLNQSANGLPIPGYVFGRKGPQVLILGGVHGDEREGVEAAYGLCQQFAQSFPYHLNLTIFPAFNIDGVLNRQRLNGHGVDLNRNMATND